MRVRVAIVGLGAVLVADALAVLPLHALVTIAVGIGLVVGVSRMIVDAIPAMVAACERLEREERGE